MRKSNLLILAAILLVLISCASNDDKNEEFDAKGTSEQELYQEAVQRLEAQSWTSAIQSLQLLEEYFPFGAYAEQAQLELIFAYYKSGEYDAAIASAERFIRLNPQHPNVDYAYYMRGVASFSSDTSFRAALIADASSRDAGSAKLSFDYFTELLTRFPASPYGPDARKRMEHLRNTLARYEIHVANYYFKRGAFLAAANRGRYVVENMQTTPAVPDGLAVMAQAYHLLGMQDLSDDAVKVLYLNYPAHPSLTADGKFIYQYKLGKKTALIDWLTFGLFRKNHYVKFDSREQFNEFYKEDPVFEDAPQAPSTRPTKRFGRKV